MKLFNDLKQLILMTMCAISLMSLPMTVLAAPTTSNMSNAQQMDRAAGTNDATDISKGDVPPKPSPKPGPRDGGADD